MAGSYLREWININWRRVNGWSFSHREAAAAIHMKGMGEEILWLPACLLTDGLLKLPFPYHMGKQMVRELGVQYAGDRTTKARVENGCVWRCVDMAKEKYSAQGQSSNYTARLRAPFMNYFCLFSLVPPNRYATASYIVGWDSIWSYVTDFRDHEKLDNSKRFLNVQWQKISSKPST